MEKFEDDFIPFLFPWYGTGVVPSALGCEVVFNKNQDPATGSPVIHDVSAISTLRRPDFYKDGLMPKVLNTIDFMRENTSLPVSVTDPQGPFNIALSICWVENLFIWMCTHASEVHQLMEFCTDLLIDWIKIQKEHAGQELNSGAWPHGIYLPEGFGGVWLATFLIVLVSPCLLNIGPVFNFTLFGALNIAGFLFCLKYLPETKGKTLEQMKNIWVTKPNY